MRTRTLRAVILCAGQGRRLMPLTEFNPKCLLPVAGMPVLEWQLRALAANGITDVTVVTGFGADRVEAMLAGLGDSAAGVRPRFNPFYAVADNTGSCFLARDVLEQGSRETGGCLLLNGDTLFEPAILRRLLDAPAAPITVTIDRKAQYDDDDMKVSLAGTRLLAIGKTLPPERTQGESIGMLLFRGEGGARFAAGVEAVLRRPDGLKRWYLSVIDALAAEMEVRVASIEGLSWGEIDFPADVMRAEMLGQRWREAAATVAAAE
ncbi:phosphocholine cytidylyltransferase family protein [Roseomonas marmotae]|uniref:Phosphocholine cytidylyltransferase family protein n=1 Tax=Roseomonas marmotae TaxID=2768161 RepID=A0ABS3KHT1_9PROT|nr:phosphocholine cytidylyltransferase family protein [Roseomonas marmotae]MBO1075876.1 phosphocholine cytidylyltransferase family protein [Roseomonas marmotae]QTI81936.1 phosphocholine cytidylyltransferase family protein [Roseomonas marmotae]